MTPRNIMHYGRDTAIRKLSLKLLSVCWALAFFLTPDRSSAQLTYDHTTFLNGFGSDSTIWSNSYTNLGNAPISYLAVSVVLKTPAYPDLNRMTRYSDMVNKAISVVNTASGQHVLVGHSLGSLVARGTYMDNATARTHIVGIVALTPPHQGVLIADSVVKIRNYFGDVERRVEDAVPSIIMASGAVSLLTAYYLNSRAAGMALWIGSMFLANWVATSLDLSTLYQITQVPALPDLSPSSPVIDSLNRFYPDAQIQRAQVYGTIPTRYAALRLLSSMNDNDAGFPTTVFWYNVALIGFKACKHFNYMTIVAWTHGRRCGFAYRALRRLDDRWTRYVDGTDAFGRPLWQKPFDGVVPNDRSRYPAPSTSPISFDQPVPGANHINIYKTQLGLNQVKNAMLAIGMQPVNAPPNGITALSVTGPSRVNGCQGATWTATRSGGVSPVTYRWKVENQTIDTGTSNQLPYTNLGTAPSIFVQVTATDANFSQKTSNSFKTNLTLPGSC